MKRHFFLLSLAALLLCLPCVASAQIQIGTVKGVVVDPVGAPLAGVSVALVNRLTNDHRRQMTGSKGEFAFNNVPFALYTLKVEASGFDPTAERVNVNSNLPVSLIVKMSVAAVSEGATIKTQAGLIESESTSTQTRLGEGVINRTTGATSSLALQRLIATTPGWTTQNNGLLHVRGVDDGILYVVDGIPTVDRLDAVSASSFDAEMIRSLNVITGNMPAEFGGRSGAVVQIQPGSGIDSPLSGTISTSTGSFRAGEMSASFGGRLSRTFGAYISSSGARSDRFLDPVDPDNFNNHGGAIKVNSRFDWHPTDRNIVLLDLATNGTDFRVPNSEEQQLAGQRQRQELRDNSQSISWQRLWPSNTVTNLAYFRREYRTQLIGSEADTPIFAEQDRHHVRQGVIASLTHTRGKHIIKAGLEASRVTPREFFSFAITDEEEAEELDISEAALEFDRDNPFIFSDRRTGANFAWYAQDSFSPARNLTVNAGLRYDRSTLPITDQQFSPRLGVVYHFPKTNTAVRASFNRLFMPPQVENLLLADSAQARALSPFVTETGGGAAIKPEKISAYEAGVAQDVKGLFKLDVAFWHRRFRNFDDPNVFFNTTIIFPNSVASGFARGLDVRLDVPQRRGWSGYASYTNARILQTGPINGGLFLTDEFIEIGLGTRFLPDHDQRNVGAFGATYQRRIWWASLSGRHESGVPLEVEPERLEELKAERGAELVNFDRRRVKPWTIFDFSTGLDLFNAERVTISLQANIQNFTDHRFAYNFGNPFEGTHFGYPRMFSGRIKINFR
ncbi:MAG: TonB-dependent receptor [Acidobacteriota bacterium]|nr:TonB-dependent receptor [Acidobacteriota bacterium]